MDEILETGRPKIVTRSGQPAVIMQAIDQEQLVEVLASRSKEFVKEREKGRKDVEEGRVYSQAQVDQKRRGQDRITVVEVKQAGGKARGGKVVAATGASRGSHVKSSRAAQAAASGKTAVKKGGARKTAARKSTRSR